MSKTNWATRPLGEITLKIGSGATPRGGKDSYIADGISLIRSQNVYNGGFQMDGLAYITDEQAESLSNVEIYPQDVLINITGDSVARTCMVPSDVLPARVNQHVSIVRANPEFVDSRFLRFTLISPDIQARLLQLASAGATRNALTKTMLENLEIPLPSLPEQRRIAHILGTLDDKIELNRKMNTTLDEIARTLFRSWFVDFDPVRAKMEGRQPAGMDAATAALFPDRLVESELGLIPEGWKWSTVADAFALNPPRRLKQGVDAPFLEMKNVPTSGHRPLSVERRLAKGGARFQNGDTLFARITPCLENGKTAWVDFLAPDEIGFGSTEYIVMNAKPPLPAIWSYLIARHEPFREFAERAMTGTSGRQRVSGDALGRYLVAIPNAEIALRFEDLVRPMFETIRSNDEESRTLAALRDTLLPELLGGSLMSWEEP